MTNRAMTFVRATAVGLSLLCVSVAGSPGWAQEADQGDKQDVTNKRVTLNLENADIQYALKLLFTSVGVDFTIGPGVQGYVTASLTDVPFRVALEQILRSTQSQFPLTYRVESGKIGRAHV